MPSKMPRPSKRKLLPSDSDEDIGVSLPTLPPKRVEDLILPPSNQQHPQAQKWLRAVENDEAESVADFTPPTTTTKSARRSARLTKTPVGGLSGVPVLG